MITKTWFDKKNMVPAQNLYVQRAETSVLTLEIAHIISDTRIGKPFTKLSSTNFIHLSGTDT
jgi:hypothetical protein